MVKCRKIKVEKEVKGRAVIGEKKEVCEPVTVEFDL